MTTTDTTAPPLVGVLRDQMLLNLDQVRLRLSEQGYQPFRVGEFLHPKTLRHIRIGYAGNEFYVHVGQMPTRPANGHGTSVDKLAVRLLWSIRTDLGHLARQGRPVPTVESLMSEMGAASWPTQAS